MKGLTGFDTARKIYELFPRAKIAFATNYYDFTREGYKYNAVRYLVKQEKTFNAELMECISYVLKNSSQDEKMLELSDSLVKVRMDNIIYIGSDKHYIEYLKNRKNIFNRHQIIQCFMIMGGVPYYWSLLKKGKSLPQNIDELFFVEKAPLQSEYNNLYRALFKKPDQYIKIIEALF